MTKRLTANQAGLETAAHILRQGGLVAFGTETVYGLGGDATQPEAVSRIFQAKNRPRFNPLISHFPSAEAAFSQVIASPLAHLLAETFWPGPLTLILPRAPGSTISDLAADGLSTLAVRVPRGEHVLSLLALTGRPVAAPSANRSGRISPSAAEHVFDELDGRIDAVLDTGPCAVGLESTVLDLTAPGSPVLLRHGGIPAEALEKICGPLAFPQSEADAAPLSPGRMLSHYAPALPVRLNATSVEKHEALLAFGPAPLTGAGAVWNLSETGNLEEAAARLFQGLRYLDTLGAQHGFTALAVQPVPASGIGLAIQDRLRRAAAPPPRTTPGMTAFDPKELKTLSDILALILDEEQGQSASALDAIKARARRNKITGGALKNLFQTITDDPSWRSSFKNTKAQTQDKSEEYLARLGQMRTTLNETSEELTATRNYTHKLHAQLQYAISLRKETEMELAEQITRRHYPSRVMIFALFGAGLIVGAATAEILHVLLHTATHVVTDNARYLY